MQNLLIEQRGPSGLMKTWRLRADQGTLTFGNSKHADLRSPLDSVKGIQGLFEFRGGKWYYINLDLHSVHSQLQDGKTEICLDQPSELEMGVSHLIVMPFDARDELFSSFDEENELTKPAAHRKPYQLFAVHHGEQLLETTVIQPHQTFRAKADVTRTKLAPVKSDKWVKTQVGDLEISQRTVYLTSNHAILHLTKDQIIDEGGRKTLYATLAGALLLALLFLMAPAAEQTVVEIPKPIQLVREISTPIVKKKAGAPAEKAEPVVATQQPAPPAAQPVAPPDPTSGASKTVSAIKSLSTGRISKLIGKVSAAAARSANVVVTSGLVAGSSPTGRALAAVGSLSKSGKDWGAEGKGTGIKISTNGIAGGQGVGNMGTLNAGKTGTGGVGLLEDEGEINGGLDREVIAQYIKSKLGEILYCYERQLSANPDLYGKVAVKFQINGTGQVDLQRIGDSTLKNATVEGCILQKVARWKFPQPDGGTKVLVTYPFLFKSTN
jgi:hypothetical protein